MRRDRSRNVANPNAHEFVLYEEAERLSGGGPLPVDLAKVCSALEVRVRRSKIGRARALLIDAEGTPQVLLAEKEPFVGYSVRERFLVAHELAHLILYRMGVPRPVSRHEYWKYEHVCDCFSRRLLLPEKAVKGLIDSTPRTGVQILNLSCRLARVAQAPWPAGAHRISDREPDVAFFRITADIGGRLRVTVSTLPNKKEIHRRFAPSDAIAVALGKLPIRSSAVELDLAALRGFGSICNVWGAAALRVSAHETRLAIISRDTEQDAVTEVRHVVSESAMWPLACPGT